MIEKLQEIGEFRLESKEKGKQTENKKRSGDDAEGKNVNRGKEKRLYMFF